MFDRLLQRQFTALLSPRTGTVLGNFAAVDLKDVSATFAATTLMRSGAVLAAKVSGGAADGLVPLLRGNEFNATLAATAQLHLPIRGPRALVWDESSCRRYEATVSRIERDHALALVEVSDGRNFAATRRGLRLRSLAMRADTLRGAVAAANDTLRRDSLRVELARTERERALVEEAPAPGVGRQLQELHTLRSTRIRQAEDTLSVEGFTFSWFSLEYGVANSAFRLFDPSVPPSGSVAKRSFAAHRGGLRYSRYRFSEAAYETRLLSVAALVSLDHNLSDLTKHELTERTRYADPPAERVGESKYTAYSGDYESRLAKLTLAADAYQFLFHGNPAALHLYPSVGFRKGSRPTYNLGIGILMIARTSEKDASAVNAELYYDLTDLRNAGDSEDGLLRRSGLGLRVTVPLNFRSEI